MQRARQAGALVVGLALAVLAIRDVHRAVTTNSAADLVVDHSAARAFRDGYSPFSPEGARRAGLAALGPTGLGHPPTTSFWLLPLASFDLQTARAIVAWTSVILLAVEVGTAAALLGWSPGAALLLFGFVASAPFFIYMTSLGQVSQWIAFACFGAWWALRRGRPVLAGAALGAATTLKLFPGILVLWLALTRRWRAFAAAVALYLMVAAVMTLRFGLASWAVFFRAQREVADAWVANVANQSLHGVVQRLWASPACELPGPVAPEALALSASIAVALIVFAARRTREDGSPGALDRGFAVFSVLAVLTSQWAWPHYDVLFVVPALIAATALRQPPRWWGLIALAALALAGRISVRLPGQLQNALWRGDRAAHLPLHLAEALTWVPGVLLLAVLLCVSPPKQAR
jgi:hypothetical protein